MRPFGVLAPKPLAGEAPTGPEAKKPLVLTVAWVKRAPKSLPSKPTSTVSVASSPRSGSGVPLPDRSTKPSSRIR